MGMGHEVYPYMSVFMGRFSSMPFGHSIGEWRSHEPMLVIGNGSSAQNRSNALVLYKNGLLQIAGSLTQNSDARLKKDITPISDPLATLEQIAGYRYYWKSEDRDDKLHYGLLAQQVQEVLPQLVSDDGSGTLSVNYIELIPLLIEGMKAQQERIEKLERKVRKSKSGKGGK